MRERELIKKLPGSNWGDLGRPVPKRKPLYLTDGERVLIICDKIFLKTLASMIWRLGEGGE